MKEILTGVAKAGSCLVMGFALAAGGTALAATATGTKRVVLTDAVAQYSNQAAVDNISKDARTIVSANKSVPAGYMGGKARLYKGSALCTASGFVYNNAATAAQYVYSPRYTCGAGVYSSRGASEIYSSGAYYSDETYASPNLNF